MLPDQDAFTETRDFIEHIDDWIEYLTELLTLTDEVGTIRKYERQIKYLLKFRMGLNANIQHNKLLLHYYSHMAKPGGEDIRLKSEVIKDSDTSYRTPKISAEAQRKVKEVVAQATEFITDMNMSIKPKRPIQDSYKADDPAFLLIKKALASDDLFFLQGPPGTGKTTAIVEIVLQTLAQKPHARILISSETHVAVDNALDRLSKISGSRVRAKMMRYPRYTITEFETELTKETDAEVQNMRTWERADEFAPELSSILEANLDQGQVKDGIQKIPRWQFINAADNKQIIGVTCNQIDHLIDEESQMFDLVIVDECSKATMPEWIMAMSMGYKCILVGDHNQLPPTFCEEESEALKTLTKQKEKLIRNGVIDRIFQNLPHDRKGTLEKQYRMLPHIGQFISEHFYEGKLQHHRESTDHNFNQFGWCTYHPNESKFPKVQGGVLENSIEAGIIIKCLDEMLRMRSKSRGQNGNGNHRKLSVAVITPYRAQCRLLRNLIESKSYDRTLLGIEVDTVDAFQGRQADVIFFSFVRTWGPATFYADSRRMNVAISRARDGVYLVGDKRYIHNSGRKAHLKFLLALSELPVI